MRRILNATGGDLSDLVDVTCFLVDMADYEGFNAVYNEYFTKETGPARTTVAVKQLPCKPPNRLLIEIKGTAFLP